MEQYPTTVTFWNMLKALLIEDEVYGKHTLAIDLSARIFTTTKIFGEEKKWLK